MKNILLAYSGAEELEQQGLLEGHVEQIAEEAAKAEVAEAVAEVSEVSEEVAEIAEKLEELEEAHEELVETVEGMEELLASGSFHGGTFARLYSRAGKLSAKLGGSKGDRQGVESFGDASTATINARNGMEGFMDTAKKWGNQAIEFIKALFNRLISFVVGIFDTAKGLDKRVSFLEERVKKAEIKDDKKVSLGGWNTFLDIATNKTPSNVEVSRGGAGAIYTSVFGSGFANSVESAAKAGDMSPVLSSFKTQYETLLKPLQHGKDVTGSDSDTTGKLLQVGAWRMLVSFYKGDMEKVADMVAALKALSFKFTKDGEAAKKLTGDSVPALAKSELSALLTSAKSTITSVQKAKLEDQFSKGRRDKIVGLLTIATKDVEDKKDVKAAVGFIKQYCATSGSFLTAFTKAQLRVAEAKINCVAAHV